MAARSGSRASGSWTSRATRPSSRSSMRGPGSTISRMSRRCGTSMTCTGPASGERRLVAHRLPRTREDWQAKRAAVEAVLDELGGVVIRVGDETVGEMWSLYDGQDVLNEVDPRFADNIRAPRRAGRCTAIRSTSPPTPIPRATAPSGRRTRTRTCCCMSVKETDAGHRGPRRQVRDRGGLRQPGVRQADDRELGRRRAVRLRGGLHRAIWTRQASSTSAAPASPGEAPGRGLSARQPVRRGRHARWCSTTC